MLEGNRRVEKRAGSGRPGNCSAAIESIGNWNPSIESPFSQVMSARRRWPDLGWCRICVLRCRCRDARAGMQRVCRPGNDTSVCGCRYVGTYVWMYAGCWLLLADSRGARETELEVVSRKRVNGLECNWDPRRAA